MPCPCFSPWNKVLFLQASPCMKECKYCGMVYQDKRWHHCSLSIKCKSGKVIRRIYKRRQMTLDNKILLGGQCDKVLLLRKSPKIYQYALDRTGSTPFSYSRLLVYVSHNYTVQACLFYSTKEELTFGPDSLIDRLRQENKRF